MLRNYCYCPSFPQLFASVCLFWKRPGEPPCPRSWPVELGGRRLETILQVRVNQLLPRSPCQAAQCKRGIQALGLSPWDFTQDCYYSPAGKGEHTGEQTTGNEKVAPGSRHRMAYTEPEVTCPGGSLPFTCQGRASWKPRHARTASRFHEADRPHTGPQLHHRLVNLGLDEALEMRLELKGCSGAHTPAHGPQQPHPELGAPLSMTSPCAPSCSPLPKLAG